MKKLKRFLLVLILCVGLVLIIAFIAPSGYEVSRSITVERSVKQVFDYASDNSHAPNQTKIEINND